jgi:carbamoyl-phosphate synthase large subunit
MGLRPNVIISSAGRRSGLLQAVRESLAAKRPGAWVGAVDSGISAPVRFLADRFWKVPRCTDPDYGAALLEICGAGSVGLIVPTIDTELGFYARNREAFKAAGVDVFISEPPVIGIACDKNATHQWLVDNSFPTVHQAAPANALKCARDWKWPLIAKPFNGSASIGVRRIESEAELAQLTESNPDYVVQEMARGREFTINIYVNSAGQCVCAVPHWRMETRAGEVSKGITVKDPRLMALAAEVAEALPGARGPLNMQCFLDADGVIAIIEINARFGGGYPLAHHAGARFTDWLLDEQEGRVIGPYSDWTDDLAMLRYDEAVFTSGTAVTAL